MLRVRELAATGMERSSVKAEMTEAGDGGRSWRLERAEDDGNRAWRAGTVIRKGLRVRRLAGGLCR